MPLKKIDLKDKPLFDRFLKQEKRENSAFAFENIFIWKNLFNIYEYEFGGLLLVFFEDSSGFFLYLPPLGPGDKASAAMEAFRLMEERNGKASPASRIENISAEDTGFYTGLGLDCTEVSCDYLSLRDSIAGYKGDKFKHKRSAKNHFEKRYKFDYLRFSKNNEKECISLYDLWAGERKERTDDRTYLSFLKDNRTALLALLENHDGLDIEGRVVKIDGSVRAFTFGYEISDEVFAVLYEIADLSFKGISQYLFSRFASELPHKYLNIMSDSGLDNLRKVKLSFHPERTVPIYIAVKRPGN